MKHPAPGGKDCRWTSQDFGVSYGIWWSPKSVTPLKSRPAKTAKIKDVSGSPPPKKYKHRLKSSMKPKKVKTTSQLPKKRKPRSDKGVKRGPRTAKVDKGSNTTEEHGEKTAKEIVGGRRNKRSSTSVEDLS